MSLGEILVALEPLGLMAARSVIADLLAKRDASASLLELERHVEAQAARRALGLPQRAE